MSQSAAARGGGSRRGRQRGAPAACTAARRCGLPYAAPGALPSRAAPARAASPPDPCQPQSQGSRSRSTCAAEWRTGMLVGMRAKVRGWKVRGAAAGRRAHAKACQHITRVSRASVHDVPQPSLPPRLVVAVPCKRGGGRTRQKAARHRAALARPQAGCQTPAPLLLPSPLSCCCAVAAPDAAAMPTLVCARGGRQRAVGCRQRRRRHRQWRQAKPNGGRCATF